MYSKGIPIRILTQNELYISAICSAKVGLRSQHWKDAIFRIIKTQVHPFPTDPTTTWSKPASFPCCLSFTPNCDSKFFGRLQCRRNNFFNPNHNKPKPGCGVRKQFNTKARFMFASRRHGCQGAVSAKSKMENWRCLDCEVDARAAARGGHPVASVKSLLLRFFFVFF